MTHPQTPELGLIPPEPPRWGPGRLLRMATGVREDLLDHVPSERARYTSMGGVVVGTAMMAMLSMAAALYFIFGGFQPFIVFAVPVWGMFILSLDRWLMSSTVSRNGRMMTKLLPRLALSIALGVIVAEPLLLGIYHTAIEEKVAKDRQQELVSRESDLRTCNPIPGTAAASGPEARDPRCAELRLAVGGKSPEALVIQQQTLSQQAVDLKKIVDADAKAYAELQRKSRLECNGTDTPETTGKPGVGINCVRLRNEADQYRRDHKIDQNAAKLTELNNKIAALTGQVGDSRISYSDALNAEIRKDLDEVRQRQGAVGLLERFRALDELVAANTYVLVTLWAIRIFFILVDALPVILKALSGRAAYDRILELWVTQQEGVQAKRADEETDKHARYGDVVRRRTETWLRGNLDLVEEESRIQRAHVEERRDELIESMEKHLMNIAIGPAGQGWSGHSRVLDADNAPHAHNAGNADNDETAEFRPGASGWERR
ncbi:DUF4407 domain-containing protein [Actinoplanes sp. CA-142083]|uniref:DUF4407 domain-containing protein n=1 Tax=Actinoplanes sp. CA-142083 TaxID=3239903 RepID=UPI003D9103D5